MNDSLSTANARPKHTVEELAADAQAGRAADQHGSRRRVSADWTVLAERLGDCRRLLAGDLAPFLERHGLTEAEFSLLWLLSGNLDEQRPTWHQRKLAQHLSSSPARISSVVEELRSRGLLVARRLATDRRRQYWELASRGMDVFESLLAEFASVAEAREAAFGTDNRMMLQRLLEELASRNSAMDATMRGKEAA